MCWIEFILNPYTVEKHSNESFDAALVYVRKLFKVVCICCVLRAGLQLLLSVCGLSGSLNIALGGDPSIFYWGFDQDHGSTEHCSTSLEPTGATGASR